jgi:peptide/nickel transport system permease protein
MSAATLPLPAEREPGRFAQFARHFAERRSAVAGIVVLAIVVLAAALAPLITPQNPYDLNQVNILDNLLPPGERNFDGMVFVLGSDGQGRDMYSAILYGLRTSLIVGILSAVIALAIGSLVGLASAYAGGVMDNLLMRLVDLQLSLPAILVALILLVVLGGGADKIVLALVVVQWAYFARTVRGVALVENAREYMQAARGLRLSTTRLMLRHLLPNCLPTLIVVATVQVATAISLEATLSFLGLGLPPTQPSLGLLIANGFQFMMSGAYWIALFPGFALLVTIVAINLVGDRLRDVLNPRLER